jgi:hypothetical protein
MSPYSPSAILRPPCPSLPRAASRDEVCDLSGPASGHMAPAEAIANPLMVSKNHLNKVFTM